LSLFTVLEDTAKVLNLYAILMVWRLVQKFNEFLFSNLMPSS